MSVREGAGPQSRAWATAISPGPANEAGAARHLLRATRQPVPVRDRRTTLGRRRRAAHLHGRAVRSGHRPRGRDRDRRRRHRGRRPRPRRRRPSRSRSSVNQPPTITDAGDQTVARGRRAHRRFNGRPASAPGSGRSRSDRRAVGVERQPSLFTASRRSAQTGVLTYTPAADANGIGARDGRAHDDGGTANGGHDTTDEDLHDHRRRPSTTRRRSATSGNVSVLENAGTAVSSPGYVATAAGPTDEAAQQITYSTSNDNTSLFTAGGQPTVARHGTLTFTPAASNAAGSAQSPSRRRRRRHGERRSRLGNRHVHDHRRARQPGADLHSCRQSERARRCGRTKHAVGDRIDPGAPNESAQTVTFTHEQR